MRIRGLVEAHRHCASVRQGRIDLTRRVSLRGSTYGVVCVALVTVLLGCAIVAARFLSTGANPIPGAPASPSATPAPTSPPSPSPAARPAPTTPKPTATPPSSLADALIYSKSLGASHLIGRGTISPRAGGYSEAFQYERLNNVERIQVAGGNFVRSAGGPWVRSDGWSMKGTPASSTQTSMLNDLVGMTNVAWSPRATTGPVSPVPPPKEEASSKVIYSVATQDSGQQVFTFRKVNSGLQLERFSGLVGSGADQVQVKMDYAYPAAPIAAVASPTQQPTARKAPGKTKAKSTRRRAARKNSRQKAKTTPTPSKEG